MDVDRTEYERQLRNAYDMGRRDGRAAARIDLQDPDCEARRGLGPHEFAARSWERRPGRPPAGLPVNGARWYAAGFRAGLAEQVAAAAVPSPRRAASPADVPFRAG